MNHQTSASPPKPPRLEDDRAIGDWNMLGVIGKYAILYTSALDRLDVLHTTVPGENEKNEDAEEETKEEEEPVKVAPPLNHIDRVAKSMDAGVKIYYEERDKLLAAEGGKQTAGNLQGLLTLARNKPLGAFKVRELDARAYAEFLFLFHFFPAHLMLMTPPDAFQKNADGAPTALVVTRNARIIELYQFSTWIHTEEAPRYFKPLYQLFFPSSGENLPQLASDTDAIARVTIKIHDAMLETHNNTLQALAVRCSEEQLEEVSNNLRDGVGISHIAQRFGIAEKTLWVTRAVLLFLEETVDRGDATAHLSQRKVERQAKQQSERNRKIQARNERNARRNAARRAKRGTKGKKGPPAGIPHITNKKKKEMAETKERETALPLQSNE